MNFCKNEKLHVLRRLITIGELLVKCKMMLPPCDRNSSCDDQERYLKMAMRIDSNDPSILFRKKKNSLKLRITKMTENND